MSVPQQIDPRLLNRGAGGPPPTGIVTGQPAGMPAPSLQQFTQGGTVPGGPQPQAPQMPFLSQMGGLAQTPTMQFIQAELSQQGQDQTTGQLPQKPTIRKGKKKPDQAYVDDMTSKAVSYWAQRDTRMDEDLSLYRLTKDVAGAGEVVQKNTPFVVVEKAANMLASQTPTIQIIPPQESQKDQAQKVEDFLKWSWERWNKRWRRSTIQGSLNHAMAHFLCLRGWAAMRIWYDPDTDPSVDHPIRVKLYDPRQVYPLPGDDGMICVVHKYYTTYGELNQEWPDAEKAFKDEDLTAQVEVTEYYDEWFHTITAEGQVVKKITPHEYGFIPWVIVTGNGSPVRATSTDQTSWVQEVGVSMFHGIKDSYKSLNKVLSQLATQVANATNPPSLYYYDPNLNKTPMELDYTAGTTNFLFYDRERVEPIHLSPNPQEVSPLMDSLIDDIQKGTLPSILWGQGGVQAGFAMSMMTDAARDQLYAIVEAMQECFEQINEYTLKLVRDFVDGDIGFYVRDVSGTIHSGVSLSPEEVQAVGTENIVKYRDISPKDRASMAQLAALLTDKKLISMETAREDYLGIDNPERENQRVLFDLINMDEDIIKKGLVPLTLYQTDPALFSFYLQLKMAELSGQQPAQQPGMPPQGGPQQPQAPGLPPGTNPALMQPGANPLLQSIGSALGGPGGGLPQGVPGAGALPLGMSGGRGLPLGL